MVCQNIAASGKTLDLCRPSPIAAKVAPNKKSKNQLVVGEYRFLDKINPIVTISTKADAKDSKEKTLNSKEKLICAPAILPTTNPIQVRMLTKTAMYATPLLDHILFVFSTPTTYYANKDPPRL
jgi:hypothetical protein